VTAVAAVSPSAVAISRAAAQRRIVTVLVVAQVLSGAGLAAGITVGALLAQDMLGSTGLAGLPSALFTAGSALTAVTVGRLSQARGRRPGLAAGYLAGALGAIGVVVAAVIASPVLLFLALFVYGAGSATNLQARYAGADLAPSTRRARAVSTVLVATTLGGVLGPNLSAPTGNFARLIGVPYLAGPFLLAAVAYTAAATVLATSLRPDPLLLARALESTSDHAVASPEPEPEPEPGAGAGTADGGAGTDAETAAVGVGARAGIDAGPETEAGPGPRPGVGLDPGVGLGTGGVAANVGAGTRSVHAAGPFTGVCLGAGLMAGTQLSMVATMTMTPVFMHAHGHGTAASGLVIAVHVAAMYLPSPITGRLVDRRGYRAIAFVAAVSLLAAGLLAATPAHFAPTSQVALLAVALALLGFGWNLGLLAGTTVITNSVPIATRAATQGKVDVVISVTGAAGGLSSGLVVETAGYPTLTLAGAVISFTLLTFLAATPPTRRTVPSRAT